MTLKPKSVVRERAGMIRHAIADVMQTSPDRAAFVDRMRGHGIETVTRINTAGRLYGITFIDDANGIAVNGSRLGKGLCGERVQCLFRGRTESVPRNEPAKRERSTGSFCSTFQKGGLNPQGSALLKKK